MKKRILTLLLAGTMLLSMVGCASGETKEKQEGKTDKIKIGYDIYYLVSAD